MKNFSRRLKKTAPLILLGLILDHSPVHQSAQALVGGPFDDNNYSGSNADGTYSGTISGHNLTGIVSFGVSSSQETNGRFSVFHEGFVHYGAATGIADLQSRRVAGSLLGVATLGGSGVANSVSVTETTGGSGQVVGTQTQTITVRTGLEGSFVARMKGYPNFIKFEGHGRLSTNANTAVVTTPTSDPRYNPGYTVFFGSDGSPQIQTDSVQDGFGSNAQNENSNIASTGGNITVDSNPQRAILRSETPFKIRGSRTSRVVYSAIMSYSSTAPLNLTTPTPTTPAATPTPIPAP
jgi:hypothetical protein